MAKTVFTNGGVEQWTVDSGAEVRRWKMEVKKLEVRRWKSEK
jgi:hypothetical protein